MESLIKEMNYHVKGSEKFWNNPAGANHILAVKAAALSEDERFIPAHYPALFMKPWEMEFFRWWGDSGAPLVCGIGKTPLYVNRERYLGEL